jgi:pimeloyl-ACP methyl ester carboxylesterase
MRTTLTSGYILTYVQYVGSVSAMINDLNVHAGGRLFTGLSAGPDNAPLTVLLHGFPQTSRAWRWQTRYLGAAGQWAVAPDLRGLSPAGPRPPDIADYRLDAVGQDVMDLAEALGHRTFHLVGHDLGGIVAWYLAAHHPERVRTLTAVSTPHLAAFAGALHDPAIRRVPPFPLFRRPAPTAEQIMLADDAAALRAAYAGLEPEDVTYYVQTFRQPGILTAALNYFRAIDYDQWFALPRVTVPTQFVWGAEDPYLADSTAQATADHVEGSYRAHPLTGVAHWVPDTARPEVSRLILGHIVETETLSVPDRT